MAPKAKPKASAKAKSKAKEEQAGEIIQCFEKIDTNKDGTITHDELAQVMRELDPKVWTDKKVKELLKDMDKNGDGKISVDEFVTYIVSSRDPTDQKTGKGILEAAKNMKKEDVAGPEGTDGKEALANVLEKLFAEYDNDEDGKIERIEFLEGEEKRIGNLYFGPKPRREAMAWFKEMGAEGTPVDGMFVSREKWDAAIKKLAEAEVGADSKKQADWIFENRLKALLAVSLAEEEAKAKASGGGEGGAAPIDPAVAPTYPLTIAFTEVADRIKEACSWKKSVLVLSSGIDQVESFLTYQNYGVLDAKMYINEMFVKKAKTLDDARAEVKTTLTQCMNSSGFCKSLHIRLNNSAFDFLKLCEDGVVPTDVFDGEKWTPEAACAKGFFDEGHKFNVEVDDQKKWKDFNLIISSTFDLEKAKEHLADKIPYFDKLAILVVDPNSVEK